MPSPSTAPRLAAGALTLLLHAGFVYALTAAHGEPPPVPVSAPVMVQFIAPPAPKRSAPPIVQPPPKPAAPVAKAQAPKPVRTHKPRAAPLLVARTNNAADTANAPKPAPRPAPHAQAEVAAAPPGPRLFTTAQAGNRAPVYPAMSQKLGEEGESLCWVRVGADGKVADIRLERSSGYSRLDQAAVRAVRHWTIGTAGEYLIPVLFELKKR